MRRHFDPYTFATAVWMAFFGLSALFAAAEVMDKEPAQPVIWPQLTACLAVGFTACRLKPILGAISYPLTMQYSRINMDAMNPTMINAFLKEAGFSYVAQAHLACFLLLLCHIGGLVIYYRSKNAILSPSIQETSHSGNIG